MSIAKSDEWIKAGYKLLGDEGFESIKVERLARNLELNKSGFYHYFGTMDAYIKHLLAYHAEFANVLAKEIEHCVNVDPELLLLMVKYKSFFLVESQLFVKCKAPQDCENMGEAARVVNAQLLPLWRKFSQLPEDSKVATAYLNIILHFTYARIHPNNMTFEFLRSLTFETDEVLKKVVDEKSHAMEKGQDER